MGLAPINYRLNAVNPAERTILGAQQGQQLMRQAEQRGFAQEEAARQQELQPLRVEQAELNIRRGEQQLAAQRQQLAQQEEMRRRQEEFRNEYARIVGLGAQASFEDFAELNARFPEFAQGTLDVYESLDENRKRPLVSTLAQAATALKSGNVDAGIEVAEQFVEAAEASGDMQLAQMGRAAVDLAKADPNAALAQISTLLSQIDPNLAKNVLGVGAGNRVQRSIPIGDGSVIQNIYRDGRIAVVDAATGQELTGTAAEEAVARAQSAEAQQAGTVSGARRTGTLEADIELGGQAAQEAARGRVLGTAAGEAAVSASGDIAKAQNSIELLESVRDDAALEGITGILEGRLPARTQAQQDLLVKIEQLQGQAFLQAFESLKGGGSITEREGQAATQAIARLNRAQSTEEFRAALNELIGIMESGIERAERAGGQAPAARQEGGVPDIVNQAAAIQDKFNADPNYRLTEQDIAILEEYQRFQGGQ